MRRGLLLSIFAAMLLASGVCYGQQPAYPTRQVRIVVPYPAGGPTDLIARLIAQKLGERLGQSFFVENVAGASGAVGAGQVAHAAPDGYTLLVSTNDFAVASVTNSNLPYDPVKNFSPVTHHRHLAASGGGQSVGAGEKHERAGRPHQGRAGEI